MAFATLDRQAVDGLFAANEPSSFPVVLAVQEWGMDRPARNGTTRKGELDERDLVADVLGLDEALRAVDSVFEEPMLDPDGS